MLYSSKLNLVPHGAIGAEVSSDCLMEKEMIKLSVITPEHTFAEAFTAPAEPVRALSEGHGIG